MPQHLTKKQEAFAVAVAKGAKMSEAYILAYDASGMGANAIAVEANRLLNHPKVSLRIAGLTEKAAKRAELSVELTALHFAEAAYSAPEEGPTWGEKLNALDKTARILGMYAKDNQQSKAAPAPIQVQVVMIGGKQS